MECLDQSGIPLVEPFFLQPGRNDRVRERVVIEVVEDDPVRPGRVKGMARQGSEHREQWKVDLPSGHIPLERVEPFFVVVGRDDEIAHDGDPHLVEDRDGFVVHGHAAGFVQGGKGVVRDLLETDDHGTEPGFSPAAQQFGVADNGVGSDVDNEVFPDAGGDDPLRKPTRVARVAERVRIHETDHRDVAQRPDVRDHRFDGVAQVPAAGEGGDAAERASIRATERRRHEADPEAERGEGVAVPIPGDEVVAGRGELRKVGGAEFPGDEGESAAGVRPGDAGQVAGITVRLDRRRQFGKTCLAEPHDHVIDAGTVEEVRIATGVDPSDHHGGAPDFLDLLRKPHHRVRFAGDRGEADQVRAEGRQGVMEPSRLRLQIEDPHIVIFQVARQHFQPERFSPEDLPDGVDSVALFGDASSAIRRIDQEDLHGNDITRTASTSRLPGSRGSVRPQGPDRDIGEQRSCEAEDRTDDEGSQQPLPQAEMDLLEQNVPIECEQETALPEEMTGFDANEGDEGGDADIAGGDSGELVQMKAVADVDDCRNPERDDRERPEKDPDPDGGRDFPRSGVLPAQSPEKADRMKKLRRLRARVLPGGSPRVRPGKEGAGHQPCVEAGEPQYVEERVERRNPLGGGRAVDGNRNGEERQARPSRPNQRLHFERDARGEESAGEEEIHRIQPIAALAVGKRVAAFQPHPEIRILAAEHARTGNVRIFPPAGSDRDGRPGREGGLQEVAGIRRVVPPVGIDRHDRVVPRPFRQLRRGEDGGPFPPGRREPVAGDRKVGQRVEPAVRAPVIDDEDGESFGQAVQRDGAQGRGVVAYRNDEQGLG